MLAEPLVVLKALFEYFHFRELPLCDFKSVRTRNCGLDCICLHFRITFGSIGNPKILPGI
jgi:hypothetical protein